MNEVIRSKAKGVDRKGRRKVELKCAWLVSILILTLSIAHPVQGAPGDLDSAFFSGDGKVTTDFGNDDAARAIAIQADGKIVAAGFSDVNGDYDFAVARYNANGSLDTTFSGDGRVTTDFGSDDGAEAIVIQADGKIVAAGHSNDNFVLARYNSNGTPDNTFSGDGKVTTNFSGVDAAFALAIQANGKIVAAGDSNDNFALARYNSNGTPDNTFSGDGKVTTNFSGVDAAFALAIQANGKIVAAGDSNDRFALARYNSNGSLDTTFSGDGKVTTSFINGEGAFALAIQANGKIVAAGGGGGTLDFALARYNLNGTLDTTFSGDGKVAVDSPFAGHETAIAVALQADGKIVAAGTTDFPNENGSFAVARYNSNGSIDNSFGEEGFVSTDFGNDFNIGSAMAIQNTNGKILVAGRTGVFIGLTDSESDFALSRYHAFSCDGFDVTALGTEGNNTINGTSGTNVILGLGGDDTINGLDGNDIICGGDGNDTISGGNGNDNLGGDTGNDIVNGNGGNDDLKGGLGTDTCNGGPGTDTAASGCETVTSVP